MCKLQTAIALTDHGLCEMAMEVVTLLDLLFDGLTTSLTSSRIF